MKRITTYMIISLIMVAGYFAGSVNLSDLHMFVALGLLWVSSEEKK